MEEIHTDKSVARAVDDYLEYRRLVGEDDAGKLFSPEEYEEYKRRMVPCRMRNRLYVSFGVPDGMDCKLVGPETSCFCTHRYKQHQTDFEVLPETRPIALPCKVKGCRCVSYNYVHFNGSRPVHCRCKHSAHDHSEAADHLCRKCTSCPGFKSPYTCGCGNPSHAHETLVETREEREARGRPVGGAVPYAAMGGLTGFSSLAEGYLRLDSSGTGSPALQFLSPDGSEQYQEHLFEKAYGPSCTKTTDVAMVMRGATDQRVREEEDMAYFERRYQDRLRKPRESKRPKEPRQTVRPTMTGEKNSQPN